jgi:exonuclease SbcD
MNLLHIADVHLGASYSGFGGLAERRSREVLDAFRRLPDMAAEERVDAILFAGDLFDGPQPGTEIMAAVRDTLRRFMDLCVPVFMVPGNHDAVTLRLDPYRELARGSRVVVQTGEDRPDRPWPVVDEQGRRLAEKHSIYILAAPRFGDPVHVETDSGPLHVYGIAYDSAESRDPLATFRRREGSGVHVALVHASVRDAGHWKASGSSLAVGSAELAALDVDYIALGDHHRPRMPEEFGDLQACYPGSFAACDLTETGPRGYVLAEVKPGVAARVEHRDAGVLQVAAIELDVTPFTDHVRVVESLGRMLPPQAVPVVRLVGEPAFPLDVDQVTAELAERYGHAQVADETRYYASARLAELAELDTVAGHVVRLGRERIEAAPEGPKRAVAQRALRAALRALEVD